MKQLVEYFTCGTKGTCSGAHVGLEIETDFLDAQGSPISEVVTAQLLGMSPPEGCSLKLELGRQKLELNVAPHSSFDRLWNTAQTGLSWLYAEARRLGAFPFFGPEVQWYDDLLWVQEERDEIWVALDGRPALEQLCRCSSVQFTVDVHPDDAVTWINALHRYGVAALDYGPNDTRWKAYIAESHAGYAASRYGGPEGFACMQDYVAMLVQHHVVMHHGYPCWVDLLTVADLNIDLYLRSIWWHYRLRRYNGTLALEIRPFSRREDDDIPQKWEVVRGVLGL